MENFFASLKAAWTLRNVHREMRPSRAGQKAV
jgi:hypothetical protein